MKNYLIETFRFNDQANRTMITKTQTLEQPDEPIRHLSHLINSQNKWLARITRYPEKPDLDWWLPVYTLHDLETEWTTSVNAWIAFLESKTEEDLFTDMHFIGFDDTHWSAPLKDIALQLNYHSIHHRAQIQMFIRAQGITPDFIDYIGTKYQKH